MDKPKKSFFERLTGAVNMDSLHDEDEVKINALGGDGTESTNG